MLWLVAVASLAVAMLLSPARVDPYLPSRAARLAPLLIEGIQLTRLLLVCGAVMAVLTDVMRRRWPPSSDSQIGTQWEKRDLIIAAVLAAAALGLRLPNAAESLWWDELGSQMRIVQRGLGVILAFSADGNNHIANSVLMWVASQFGSQEWVLRLPSLVIGTLLPAGVYLLFQRVGSRRVGLTAAILIALHFRMVDFSNEARGYIGTAAFSALASIAFAALCKGWNRRWAAMYVVTATLGALFVFTGIYVIVAHILLAGGLLVYHVARRTKVSADSSSANEWRLPLWCAIVGCWAFLFSVIVSALTLPQLVDYSQNRAASLHTPVGLRFYRDALPYLAGVEHFAPAALLLLAALAGYWMSRDNKLTWVAIVGPPLVLMAFFQISGNVASPRMFIPAVFPMLVGLSLWIDAQWRGALPGRAIALLTVALLAADSWPVFSRYYSVGNPKLRQLAARLPSNEVLLANAQAESNVYYFPRSPWVVEESQVVQRLEAMLPAPRFVLSGEDCRRVGLDSILRLGYRQAERLNDWTYAEHANNQHRPCFILYQLGERSRGE